MPKLELIPGTPAPSTPTERVRARLRKTAAPSVVQCPRCGCREVIETRQGATMTDGRLTGGVRAVCCAACWLKGERVVIR